MLAWRPASYAGDWRVMPDSSNTYSKRGVALKKAPLGFSAFQRLTQNAIHWFGCSPPYKKSLSFFRLTAEVYTILDTLAAVM